MDRFEQHVLVTYVGAGRHAHATLQDRGQICCYVTEHIRQNHHIEVLRVSDQPHREGVDERLSCLDVIELLVDFVEHAPEQPASTQDVTLVHASHPLGGLQMALPALG